MHFYRFLLDPVTLPLVNFPKTPVFCEMDALFCSGGACLAFPPLVYGMLSLSWRKKSSMARLPCYSCVKMRGWGVGFLLALGMLAWSTPAQATGPLKWMVRLTVDGQSLEGSPLSWTEDEVHLLGRDGRLWSIDSHKTTSYESMSSQFRSLSPSEFRAELSRLLGNEYEVTGTSHYLVAHPRGDGGKWAQRFEDLYRSFTRYFSVRKFETTPPPFPLIAVVCKNQAEFARQAKNQGNEAPTGVLGYYDIESNRITMYDMGGGKNDSANWKENAGVLIHEATHQMAFNLGVHSRYTPPPIWLAEGLAMMFESAGVNASQSNPNQEDRINYPRLRVFQKFIQPNHSPELIQNILVSDDLFHVNPGAAYAEAWAFTFYLVETEPVKYAKYLKITANRPPFTEYKPTDRMKDFVSVFGNDWPMLNARFLRFVRSLP
jgi:hypothetical protein